MMGSLVYLELKEKHILYMFCQHNETVVKLAKQNKSISSRSRRGLPWFPGLLETAEPGD